MPSKADPDRGVRPPGAGPVPVPPLQPQFEEWEIALHGRRVDLQGRRQRAAGRADPRHAQLLEPLAGGRPPARRRAHGHRPRPDRPRRLGGAARGLLARRPRGEHPRPARGDRHRAGDDRRALARRRRRDAVLLPVPPARRAPRRSSPAAGSAARSARCCAPPPCPGISALLSLTIHPRLLGGAAAGRARGCASAASPAASTCRRSRARCARCENAGARRRLPADAALGDRRARPAGQRHRPPVPARGDPDADRVGRARPHDPPRARPRRARGDAAQPLPHAAARGPLPPPRRPRRPGRRCCSSSSPSTEPAPLRGRRLGRGAVPSHPPFAPGRPRRAA